MRAARTKIGILALALLIVLSGCKKKKPNIPPPQQQAPTITQPQPQPPVEQPPAQPAPQPQPTAPTTPQPKPTTPTTTTKPKQNTHKHHVAKKPVEPKSDKTVVKEGGENVPSGQLSASIPGDQASRQRQSTAQLRQTTENNLKSITRQLSGDEQSMVQQIRTFLTQSRAADSDGDTERAYNLALKARQLSDELVKP